MVTDLPPEHRARMRMETFCNTLGYLPLQRHLLAVPIHTLEDAIRAGNEYLQMKPASERGGTNIRQVGDEEEEEEVSSPTEKVLTTVMKTMLQLVEKVDQLQRPPTRTTPKGEPGKYAESVGKRGTSREIALIRRCPNLPTRRFRETERTRNSRVLCCLQSGTQKRRD